ncbi:MAG: hypothetical protein ACETWB_03160 [Anaerolineae bacterium]
MKKPRPITARLMWVLAFIFAFLLIWKKVRIVLFVNLSIWGLIALFLGLVLGIYLIFEVVFGD